MHKRIKIKAKNGNIYDRKVVITDWLSNDGIWSQTAMDNRGYIYDQTDETIQVFGQPETIWSKK